MSRDILNKLVAEAGREMDVAVARALGYTVYHYDKDVPSACYCALWDGEGETVAPDFKGNRFYGQRPTEAEAWNDAPEFSTAIAAAFLVVHRMAEMGWICETWTSDRQARDNDAATFWRADAVGSFTARGPLPLAICRAALAALAGATPDKASVDDSSGSSKHGGGK